MTVNAVMLELLSSSSFEVDVDVDADADVSGSIVRSTRHLRKEKEKRIYFNMQNEVQIEGKESDGTEAAIGEVEQYV